MKKLILFVVILTFLSPVYAKFAIRSAEEIYNQVAPETDTAFLGRVLKVKKLVMV